MWLSRGLPWGYGSSLWVTYSFATLDMLARVGVGALVYAWHYQRFRNDYAPQMSVSPVDGLSHAVISTSYLSAFPQESYKRDLRTDFVRNLSTFRK